MGWEEKSNAKVVVRRDPVEGTVYGRDLTDAYNEPSFYTKSKQGLDGAWKEIIELVGRDPEATMSRVADLLENKGIKIHRYCAVD